jgi:hypothetical protein
MKQYILTDISNSLERYLPNHANRHITLLSPFFSSSSPFVLPPYPPKHHSFSPSWLFWPSTFYLLAAYLSQYIRRYEVCDRPTVLKKFVTPLNPGAELTTAKDSDLVVIRDLDEQLKE